jgi:FdhE protein
MEFARFASCGLRPHNRPVAETPWQQRIRRAETLAAQHPFAARILSFYLQIVKFQRDLYGRFEQASTGKSAESRGGGNFPPELPELLASFPAFLALIEKHAPSRLVEVAREMRLSNPEVWSDLLNRVWAEPENLDAPNSLATADPAEFVAMAFLQPYAEFVRTRLQLSLESYTHSLCPFCSRKPTLAVLRPLGDGARRNLLCGFCLCEWEYRRIVCPGCDEKDHAKLPVYTAEEFPYIRVECCDTCRTYLKSIDLSKNGLADPLVDELASIPLDLWAQEHGYAKLRANLLGM